MLRLQRFLAWLALRNPEDVNATANAATTQQQQQQQQQQR
jgi:hypothetical protein